MLASHMESAAIAASYAAKFTSARSTERLVDLATRAAARLGEASH